MIHLRRIAELDISAASGLAMVDDRLCVVADDETFLALYTRQGVPEQRITLFPERLPSEHAARKRQKPDLEALTRLPDGRLLALGSGSTPARMRGAVIDPAQGWSVRAVELRELYAELAHELPELNIEGAVVHADQLWLAQRGNGASAHNALIALDLLTVRAWLDERIPKPRLTADALVSIARVSLGELDGVPLGLTDLASHPQHGLLFVAAAEASASTYDDGACAGSVLGVLSERGDVLRSERLAPVCKIEGVTVAVGAVTDPPGLWLVADPDDPRLRAPLFSVVYNQP